MPSLNQITAIFRVTQLGFPIATPKTANPSNDLGLPRSEILQARERPIRYFNLGSYGSPDLRLRDIHQPFLYRVSDNAEEIVVKDPATQFRRYPLSHTGSFYARHAHVHFAYAALALSDLSGIAYPECLYFMELISVYPRSHINRPSSRTQDSVRERVLTKLFMTPNDLRNKDMRFLGEVVELCETWCTEVSNNKVYNWLHTNKISIENFHEKLEQVGASRDPHFVDFVHGVLAAPIFGASSWVDIQNTMERIEYFQINDGNTALKKLFALVSTVRNTSNRPLFELFSHQLWHEIVTQLPAPPAHYGLKVSATPSISLVEYYTDVLTEAATEKILGPFLPVFRIENTSLAKRSIDFAALITPIFEGSPPSFASRLARFAELCELLQLEAPATSKLFSALRDSRHDSTDRLRFLEVTERHLYWYDIWAEIQPLGTENTAHEFIRLVSSRREHELDSGCSCKTLGGLCRALYSAKSYALLQWVVDHHNYLINGEQQIGITPRLEHALLAGEGSATIFKQLAYIAERKKVISSAEISELFPPLPVSDPAPAPSAPPPAILLFEPRHDEAVRYLKERLNEESLQLFEEHYKRFNKTNCFRVMLSYRQLLTAYCSALQDPGRISDIVALFEEALGAPASTETHTKLAYILMGKKRPLNVMRPALHVHKTMTELAQDAGINRIHIFASRQTFGHDKQQDILERLPDLNVSLLFVEQGLPNLRFGPHDMVIALIDHLGHRHTEYLERCYDNRGGLYDHPLYFDSHTNPRLLVDGIARHLKEIAARRSSEAA